MPLPLLGTNTSFDTLRSQSQTVLQFGEDNVWDGIASLLNTYNQQSSEFLATFAERTTRRVRKYGAGSLMVMQRLDEMGTPQPQKVRAGSIVGWPLENLGIAYQYNRTYLKNKPVKELAAQVEAVVTADRAALIRAIKIAMLMGINFNFNDYLVDHVDDNFSLPVKALVNADGLPIPDGPNGLRFNGSTHTHYLASASLTNSWFAALIETVIEHSSTGTPIVWINRADEQAVTALAEFKGIAYAETIRSTTQEYGVGVKDPNNLNNRLIGYFRGAHIWVKPYMNANYFLCFMQNNGKPCVAFRVRGVDADGGAEADGAGELTLTYEDENHPLRARGWEREFGVGVYYRTSAAVGYIGGSAYVAPDPATL